MPFDGTGAFSDLRVQKLDRVLTLLSSPSRWCKGAERNRAGQYCIRGALIAVGAWELLHPAIAEAIPQVVGRTFHRIEEFNDHPKTRHSDVVAVLRRARENLAAGSIDDIAPSHPIEANRATFGERVAALWQSVFA